jgi:hypothetical protein
MLLSVLRANFNAISSPRTMAVALYGPYGAAEKVAMRRLYNDVSSVADFMDQEFLTPYLGEL